MGFLLAALASAMPVQGAAIYWDGGPFGTGTDFNDPENWDPDGFPGTADSATVQNGGTAIISADPPNAIDYFYLARNSDTRGHVEHTGGTLTINRDFHVSSLQRCVSTYYQSGGKIVQSPTNTVYMRIGGSDFSYGYYDLSGGELQAQGLMVGAGTGSGSNNESLGMLHQTGGSVTVTCSLATYSAIGNSGAAMGVYNLTGGTFTQLAGHFRVGGGGSLAPNGQLNVSGTGQFDLKQEYMYVAVHATSHGSLNLGPGGSVTVPYIMPGAGTARVNFHGGTLRANSDQADFVRLDAHVYGGGAKIDTAGYDVTIAKNLLAPTDHGVDSIAVDYGGDAYVGPPAVRITGGTGSGATAIANVSEGVVTG
ncbi:MAG TPA: hypothetical protein DD670_04905, partial [Planctomycetaceae bacterium]|nr:hypothetical protein [Planctomycetaceae bacterium]